MTKATLIVPAVGHGYSYRVPRFACGMIVSDKKGIGAARNDGAIGAIELDRLKPSDWLIFVDDDTEIPYDAPLPPDDVQLAVPIYSPAWAGAESDISAAQINFVNFVNVSHFGPLSVGSCIAVRVFAFQLVGGFLDGEWEDIELGTRVATRHGEPWGLWRTRVLVHRRYSNSWAEFR